MFKGVSTPGKSDSSLALVQNKYNFFVLFCLVRFAFTPPLFASETEIVNKTTRVPRSSIHWTEILKQGKLVVQKPANHGDLS